MKKISILLPDLRSGGVERIRLVLAHEFSSKGYDVEFVLMRAEGDLLEEARKDFNVVDLQVKRVRQLPLALVKYLRANRPDVLLAAMWPLTAVAPLAQVASGIDCKVVISEHNVLSIQYSPRGWFHRLILRLSTAVSYRVADGVIGVSKGVVSDMARLAKLKPNRLHVINNPLSARGVVSSEGHAYAERFWSAPQGSRIIAVGRFKSVKNYALLLRSFAKISKNTDLQLMLLGDGELRMDLEMLAEQLGIATQVIMPGFQSDPTPFYISADLFVLSSNNEGFGNVIVEALAAGTPIVSTNCPTGPAEILEDGKYGTLVPVGDEIALAEAMDSALNSVHDTDLLKARARDFVPETAAARYIELFSL